MGKREAAECVYEQWKARGQSAALIDLIFLLYLKKNTNNNNKANAEESAVCEGFPLNCISLCFGLLNVRVITGDEINDKRV